MTSAESESVLWVVKLAEWCSSKSLQRNISATRKRYPCISQHLSLTGSRWARVTEEVSTPWLQAGSYKRYSAQCPQVAPQLCVWSVYEGPWAVCVCACVCVLVQVCEKQCNSTEASLDSFQIVPPSETSSPSPIAVSGLPPCPLSSRQGGLFSHPGKGETAAHGPHWQGIQGAWPGRERPLVPT